MYDRKIIKEIIEFEVKLVISDRNWSGKEYTGSVVHREHGWYLPNDD